MTRSWLHLEKRWHREGLLASGVGKHGVSRNRRWHSDSKCVSMESSCRGSLTSFPLPHRLPWIHPARMSLSPGHGRMLWENPGLVIGKSWHIALAAASESESVRLEKTFGDQVHPLTQHHCVK